MGNKKKFLGGLKLLLLLLFGMPFVFTSTSYASNELNTITSGDIANIRELLGLSSGDAESYWNHYQEWATWYETNDMPNANTYNLVFFKLNQNTSDLAWGVFNGSFGNDLNFAYLNNTGSQIQQFNGWTYNTNAQITGAITSGFNLYRASTSTWNITANTQPNIGYNFNGLNGSVLQKTNIVTTTSTHAFAGYTGSDGYDWYFVSQYITPENRVVITPTPTPTLEPTSSGGTVDLSETNNKIDQVNSSVQQTNDSINSLTEKISGDNQQILENQDQNTEDIINSLTEVPTSGDFTLVSSGDILSSLDFKEESDPYENFWTSILTGLQTALTCSENQSVKLDFLGTEYTLSVSDFNFNYPAPLRLILITSCTVGIVIAELKMWRKIIIAINTGNIFNLNNKFANNDISDLF